VSNFEVLKAEEKLSAIAVTRACDHNLYNNLNQSLTQTHQVSYMRALFYGPLASVNVMHNLNILNIILIHFLP